MSIADLPELERLEKVLLPVIREKKQVVRGSIYALVAVHQYVQLVLSLSCAVNVPTLTKVYIIIW